MLDVHTVDSRTSAFLNHFQRRQTALVSQETYFRGFDLRFTFSFMAICQIETQTDLKMDKLERISHFGVFLLLLLAASYLTDFFLV